MTDVEAILTLERYFLWTGWMKKVYIDLLYAKGFSPEPLRAQKFLYKSHWLASLHVVVDGWRSLQTRNNPYVKDAEIDATLASPNVALLNDFRNAVYHFHPEYFSEKFKGFFSPDNLVWAHRLHLAFERFFDAFGRARP